MWILCMPKRDPYASVATTTVRGTRDFRRCEAGHTMCTHSYYEYRFGIRKMNYILCVINYFLVADVYLIPFSKWSSSLSCGKQSPTDELWRPTNDESDLCVQHRCEYIRHELIENSNVGDRGGPEPEWITTKNPNSQPWRTDYDMIFGWPIATKS